MKSEESRASLSPLVWIALAVTALWIVAPLLVAHFVSEWPVRGQFGDMYGAVNSLFSGLAFAGLIYTVHLQRQELSLQRRELELTRSELQRTATAQEASEKALTKQVSALESAAALNALSSVIEHYPIKISRIGSAAQKAQAEQVQVKYIERLEQMLSKLGAGDS